MSETNANRERPELNEGPQHAEFVDAHTYTCDLCMCVHIYNTIGLYLLISELEARRPIGVIKTPTPMRQNNYESQIMTWRHIIILCIIRDQKYVVCA